MHLLVGAVLVLFSALYVGMVAASLCRIRVEQLEAFHSLIAHIGAEIDGYLAPLDVIFRGFSDKRLESIGFLDEARKTGVVGAVRKCESRIFLTQAELSELERFFSGLGHSSAPEEVRHCTCFEKRFSELSAKARTELGKKMKLYRVFGMLIGIMLVVILL